MALIINDFETFAVPENLVLIIKDGSVFKSKKHNGTIGTVTADDMFRLDLTAESLPRYVFEADYETVKLQAARVNPDMNNAFSTTAAAKAIDAVDAKKISKSEFATEQQLNKESHEELQSNIDAEEAARKEEILQYNKDYTAVEVYPTNVEIPSGTLLRNIPELSEYIPTDYLDNELKYPIPASMEAVFKLRTNCPILESDVIVDWGDGDKTYIKDVDPSKVTPDDDSFDVVINHTYTESKRYIVKFFGTTYFGFKIIVGTKSIVSRVFDYDLPVAKHLNAIGNIARNSDRLLKINIPTYMLSEGLWNLACLFANNSNLISVTGAKYFQGDVRNCTTLFQADKSLETTDFVFPAYVRDGVLDQAFQDCSSLSMDISKLFPAQGFIGKGNYSVSKIFYNCSSLTGTVPADKLWRNTKINWTNTANAFTGCSEAIRLQVPVSWGGLNEEEDAAIVAGTYTCATKKEVADLAIASSNTTGQDAIVVSGEGTTKTVSLALNETDNVTLSQSSTGLKTELKIAKKGTANEGYAATYQLVDANGTPIVGSADINMIKDQFLKGAELVTGTYNEVTHEFVAGVGPQYNKYIHFVFEITKSDVNDTATDTDSHIYINVNDLFDSYTAGNGAIVIDQNANTISVVISESSEQVTIGEGTVGAVISVAADGLKISNIQNAIDYARSVEQGRAEAAEGALSGRLDIVEGDSSTVGSIAKAQADAEATAAADATAKANAAQAAAEETAAAALTTHEETNALHTAEVMFIRSTQTIAELAYNQYICKAALDGTLPAAPAEGTKRIISVLAGGEGTVISAATGDKINGLTTGLAINIANETVTLIYDATDKNWVVL